MSDQSIECYIIPAVPQPVLLPIECVAEIVAQPEIDKMEGARAKWMAGHVNWRNQRLPVMSYSSLHDSELDESGKKNAHLVVLNPIPNAVRKAYSALLCYGDIQQLSVDQSVVQNDVPESLDRRYVESAVTLGESHFVIPKLTALGVAFTYF